MSINNDIVQLSTKFFKDIKEYPLDLNGKIDCDPRYKKEVMHDIGELLAGGSITAKEMHDFFKKEKENTDKSLFYKPFNILEKHGIEIKRKDYRIPGNLIMAGRFYYHPRLQVTPPPPIISISDDGSFKASYDEEPFFLENVEKFTIRDLVDYFYGKTNSICPDVHIQKDSGAFEHMLKFWDVDFILYLIDEAFVCSIDVGKQLPKTPLDIQQYEAEAQWIYESRKLSCYEEGLDHVYARPIA